MLSNANMFRGRARALGLLLALPLMAVAGCRLEMYDQPRMEPLEASTFFADSQASRPFLKGTVARNGDWSSRRPAFSESTGGVLPGGRTDTVAADSSLMLAARGMGTIDKNASIPVPVTRGLVVRGQERYNIYCTPCHGELGDGKGMIVQRGFPAPPSFHIDRLRQAPDGHYYDVITNGFGVMYSYASRISPEDRWAITAYIRALQLSQNVPAQELPSHERNKLQGSGE